MFYFKKIDGNSPNVDTLMEHSTLDLHIMRDPETASTECNKCKKPFEKGQRCGVVSIGGKMKVEHERCPE